MSKLSKLCGIRWYSNVLSGLLMVQTSPMNMLSSTAPLGSSARTSNLHTDHQRKVRAHPCHCHGSQSFSKPYSAPDWLLLIQGSRFEVSSLVPKGKIVVQKGDTTVQNSKTLNTLHYITIHYNMVSQDNIPTLLSDRQ